MLPETLDSCVGCVFRERTVEQAEYLLNNILSNDNDYEFSVDPEIITFTTKKYTSVMIHVCHSRSRFLSCMYIHDDFMIESR